MPIYAYRCATCGFAKDHLQKLSDPVLSICPQCGQASYSKQLTAAGFQLKGNGWYVTDFKDRNKAAPAAATAASDANDKTTDTSTAAPDSGASGKSTDSTGSERAANGAAEPTARADDRR